MILDDLFAFAAKNSESGNVVSVQANVTTNHTDGLTPPATNTAAVQPADLVYVAGHEIRPGLFSISSFQSAKLIITAPRPRVGGDAYSITWQDNTFTAAVDSTTNIVYGAAGQQFITISLCDVIAKVPPQ